MMERDVFTPEERHWHFRFEHSLECETEDEYFDRKTQAIEAGSTTWVVRNFDSDSTAYDLFLQTRNVALVEDGGDGRFFSIYVRDRDGGETFLKVTTSLMAAIDGAERFWGVNE